MKQKTPQAAEPQVEAPLVDAPALEPRPPTIPETHVQAAAVPRVKVFDGRAIALDHPDEVGPLLHAEIDRLPERFRLPVVLCDLEGLTRDEAALRLRWT